MSMAEERRAPPDSGRTARHRGNRHSPGRERRCRTYRDPHHRHRARRTNRLAHCPSRIPVPGATPRSRYSAPRHLPAVPGRGTGRLARRLPHDSGRIPAAETGRAKRSASQPRGAPLHRSCRGHRRHLRQRRARSRHRYPARCSVNCRYRRQAALAAPRAGGKNRPNPGYALVGEPA